MKKEEAIERLKQNKAAAEFYVEIAQNIKPIENELKDIEAFDMAIEALQAEQEGDPQFYNEDDYWNGRVPTHDRPINASWVINEIHKNICDMCEQGIDIEDCNDCKIEKIKRIIYSAPTVLAEAVGEDMQTKAELAHIKTRLENVEKRLQGLILYGGVVR